MFFSANWNRKIIMTKMYKVFKRVLDIIISVIALIVLLPLFMVIFLLVLITSGSPVFFSQERVGRNWKPFRIFKFRTMIRDAEILGPQVSIDNDFRVTPFGRILRRYKLDELPQLINVIKGDMSIVGPRPEVKKYADAFKNDYSVILKIKPGISDYASIYYRDEASLLKPVLNVEDFYKSSILPQKIQLSHKYMNEMSFFTDIKIIFETVKALMK